MADGGGEKAGRPDPGRPPKFVPSHDAPTTPMSKVDAEDLPSGSGARPARPRTASSRPGTSRPERPDPAARRPEPADKGPRPAQGPAANSPYVPPPWARRDASANVPGKPPSQPIGPQRPRPSGEPGRPPAPGTPGGIASPGPGRPGAFGGPGPSGDCDQDTVNMRQRQPAGPFPKYRPFPPDQPRPQTAQVPPAAAPGTAAGPAKPRESLLLRIGDIPLRGVYTVAAVIATIAAVVLVFTIFSEDTPRETADRAGSASPSATASPSPSPSASLQLPAPPRALALPELPGTAATVIGLVVDNESGLTYGRLGEPWADAKAAPFTAAQRVGSARAPRTMIGSIPMPGRVPANLESATQYRALAARAARWTLRYQPTPTKVTWTASQPLAGGRGWVLGYRVAYEVNGESRTSQAVVVVADTGKEKPGLLFGTVADTNKEQYRDLNTLVTSLRFPA